MGVESATGLVHAFTSICYITPLIGAALADSLWGKYYTVVYLSVVYVLGTGLLAIFSAPQFLSFAGVLIALILIGECRCMRLPKLSLLLTLFLSLPSTHHQTGCGTGGIKPCVAAHGGDQFLESQKTGLNKFYNYFYMAINVGSLIAFFATPKIKDLNCFGKEKDCFVYAFALCSCCMAIALGIFILGRRVYRIMPAAKTFIPWKICQILSSSFGMAFKDGFKKPVLAYAQGHYSEAMIEEVKDVSTMFTVLLPAPFFWMAFDQTGTTWQNQFTMMNMVSKSRGKIEGEKVCISHSSSPKIVWNPRGMGWSL